LSIVYFKNLPVDNKTEHKTISKKDLTYHKNIIYNDTMKICKIENCFKKHYCKGFCKNHYINFYRTGNPLGKRKIQSCSYVGCQKKHVAKGFCTFHYQRYIHKRPLDLPLNYRLTGKLGGAKEGKNINWKGGIAEYPNHYQMKKIRKQKLIEGNYICQLCGQKANEVHHIDKTKTNHNLDNLIILCHKCHMINFHRQKKQTSKFIRLYGNTVEDIKKILNKSYWQVYYLHKKDLLKSLLA